MTTSISGNTPFPSPQFSNRVGGLHASPIREILAVIDRPGMISFAGGLPAAESFPEMSLGALPRRYLQYGPTEGEAELRAEVAKHLAGIGLHCDPEQILILSGSQQGIDLVAKLFIDAGTRVALEAPTYLAALQVFRLFDASFTTLDIRQPDAGLRAEDRPAFAYVIPTFQNPTGACYSHEEREKLAAACDSLGIPLFEDDPYRDLSYDPCEKTPICAKLRRASWIYQGSFSKTLAPGLRLGFLVASPDLLPYLTRLKQAADLHSNRIGQWLVLEQMQKPEYNQRGAQLAALYKAKRDAFAVSLQTHFSDLATWQVPPGGLFFWLELKRRVDTNALLQQAIEQGVAFMPGEFFYPQAATAKPSMRLNFSHADATQIEAGLALLARLLRQAA